VELAIRILKGVGLKDSIYEILADFYPELKAVFQEIDQHAKKYSISQADLNTQRYFERADAFIIMVLAASRAGISPSEVENRELLNELISQGILVARPNDRFGLKEKNISLNLSSTKKLLSLTVDHCYDEKKYLEKANWLSFLSESVDKVKVLPEIISILKDAHIKIQSLFNDPKFQGNETLFAGLVCDSMEKSEVI
jgi:hypothetical protein